MLLELLMYTADPLMVRLSFNQVNVTTNGLASDEGGCCEDCTDLRTSIDGLPVSSTGCAKAAGICGLLLEFLKLLVETHPGFVESLRYTWIERHNQVVPTLRTSESFR